MSNNHHLRHNYQNVSTPSNGTSSFNDDDDDVVNTPQLSQYGATAPVSTTSKSGDNTPVTPGRISSRETVDFSLISGDDDNDNLRMPPLSDTNNDSLRRSTTHNDPDLRHLLQREHLRGSTRMLMNYNQDAASNPAAGGHRRRWSSGDVVPLDALPLWQAIVNADDDDEDTSGNTHNNKDAFTSRQSMVPPLPQLGQPRRLPRNLRYSIRQSMMGTSMRHIVRHVHTSFLADAMALAEGTIPQSIVLSLCIGIVCGIAAYVYYTCLFFLLDYCWDTLPEQYVKPNFPETLWWLFLPTMSLLFCILVGLSVVVLGEPGDLPFTISCIHSRAYIPMNHVIPMACASLFSILAGGSLGPEAPLVAICGALGGFVSRQIFGQNNIHVVRKHTLMGMAGALSAFFGCPLGGSIFALEVNSRFGIEYFEHMVEAIFAGEICLVVFRSMSGLPIAPIWDLTLKNNGIPMKESAPWMVVAGGCIGLMGAAMAYLFAVFHWAQMGFFDKLGLLDNKRAVLRAMLGCLVISGIGVFIPHTMFWGEEEFQIIATMAPASELPFVWPTSGLIGFENDSPIKSIIIGLAKIVTISYTVASGLRGGFIFPLMMSGCCFGRALYEYCPWLPLPVAVLSFSAGMNVAITRTALASTIILGFLAGEPCAVPAILSASLCSLFATAYVPFIKTQITRSDIDHSMFHQKKIVTKVHGNE